MKAREYRLLEQVVSDAVAFGWDRAHKHADYPPAGVVQDEIERAVIGEICEWFVLEDERAEEQ